MAPPNVGDVVAERYELKTLLRGRAVTRTFLADDDQLAALVALTWFDPANVTTGAWKVFARIVEAAAHVPGLVLPRALSPTLPDPPYCVAEDPPILKFDRTKWEEVLVFGERVVEILEQAYGATRVAHRALTPSRLRTDRGHVRVLDFGVAEFERTNPDEPGYRAPEQPGSEDPRVDVYAIAVILFEMIAGKLPEANPRLKDFAAVPAEVNELIARALKSDPGQRFPDYATFRAAMRAATGMPPLQPVAPAPAPVRTPPEPNKPLAPISAPAWAKRAAPVISQSLADVTLRLEESGSAHTSPPASPFEPTRSSSGASMTPRAVLPRSREPPTEVLPTMKPVAIAGPGLGSSLPRSREPQTEVLPAMKPAARAGPVSKPPTEVLSLVIPDTRAESLLTQGAALPRSGEPPTEIVSGAALGVASVLRSAVSPIVRGREPPTEVLPVTPSARPRAVPEDEQPTVAFAPTHSSIAMEPPTQVFVRTAMPSCRPASQPDTSMESNERTEVGPRGRVPPMPDEGTQFAGDNVLAEMLASAQGPQPAPVDAAISRVPVPTRSRSVPWILVSINIVLFVVIIVVILLAG